jgi:cbb3-type cytochrome oxidase subunit 1
MHLAGHGSRYMVNVELLWELRQSEIVKLLAVNSSFYSFITHGRHYQTLKADNWLVHEDDFYVYWVGEGRNAVGTPICGDELEKSFFMYYD